MYLVFKCLSLGTLVSSDAKSAVVITAKPTLCFLPAHTTALSHPCASLHMLVCWKGTKFSSLAAGRLCLSEHVCVGYLLQLPLQLSLPKQLHRAQYLLLMQGDMDQGNRKTRIQPQAFSFCTAEPLSLQNLSRIQCGPAHIINCHEGATVLFPTSVKVSILIPSHVSSPCSGPILMHQQKCCVSPSYIASDFFSLCIFILLFASQSLQPPGLEGSVTAITGICNSNYLIP